MKARFIALFATLLLTLSNNLFAVGLGALTVESGLNEPFKAHIKLEKVGSLSEADLIVGLASTAEFEQRKMTRDFFYTSIQFTLDMKHAGGPVILLTSSNIVKEPSLDFLVKLSWPTGNILRGYTVLLEKP
jgi:pilus assembly protein FimV